MFQYPILFANLGFKNFEMKNSKLKFIVNKHILNQNIYTRVRLRDVTLKVVQG